MNNKILIIDCGSQYTQLIARRVRECSVFSEIVPFNHIPDLDRSIKGVIISGSPFSVEDDNRLEIEVDKILKKKPVLAICYGAQYLAKQLGGKVERSKTREYGRAMLNVLDQSNGIFKDVSQRSQVWMSHGDTILELPEQAKIIASTDTVKNAAFQLTGMPEDCPVYGLQFHPEVVHSEEGDKIISDFVLNTCNCEGDWTPASFVESTIKDLRDKIGNKKVILGLSGGVDSSVAALLLQKAIGNNLYGIFVNNGLLRKNEFDEVLESYKGMGLNVKGVDATNEFLNELEGISDPEKKRKAIGRVFIEVFEKEANEFDDADFLAQGTIYPDVIESVSVHGPSVTIKSHHNVGGLPEHLGLEIVEPLRLLFKDEVRKVGKELKLDPNILNRHPFPGPGLAIRVLGELTKEKISILQEVDHIFIANLKSFNLYDEVWQAAAMLLPVQSVGVMGDERTYEFVVALRAVNSSDGMTADWSKLPYDFLAQTSNDIINNVKGVNRVVYDISSKPPATIEWE